MSPRWLLLAFAAGALGRALEESDVSGSNSDENDCQADDPCGELTECARWRDVCHSRDSDDSESESESSSDSSVGAGACGSEAAVECRHVCKNTAKCFPLRRAILEYDEADPCANGLHLAPANGLYVGCKVAWETYRMIIRPTQPQIGFAAALHKHWDDMDGCDAAQEKMDTKFIPLVKYGARLYATDAHHTQSALDSTLCNAMVQYILACDYSYLNEQDFWDKMVEQGDTYLWKKPPGSTVDTLPVKISYRELPDHFRFRNASDVALTDNPWRSLAGISRKIKNSAVCKHPEGYTGEEEYPYGKNCMRAFDRACGNNGTVINFFEYYWAYFWLDMYNKGIPELDEFREAYVQLPTQFPGKYSNSDDAGDAYTTWKAAAELLVPLSRSELAKNYVNNPGMLPRTSLPGYVEGEGPITRPDGDCKGIGCGYSGDGFGGDGF